MKSEDNDTPRPFKVNDNSSEGSESTNKVLDSIQQQILQQFQGTKSPTTQFYEDYLDNDQDIRADSPLAEVKQLETIYEEYEDSSILQ